MKKFLIDGLSEFDCKPEGKMDVWAENVSDGYHTMHELYQHRMALNKALFHALDTLYGFAGISHPIPKVYKSRNHHPTSDPMFDGYFIVFAVAPDTTWTSYHYALKHWDDFKIRIADFAPPYPLNHIDSITFFNEKCVWRDA
jgi:hypothetical protein